VDPEKPAPLELSRYCIPYTPFAKTLAASRIALVSTAGIYRRGDTPLVASGDNSFRVIPGDATTADLTYSDEHYPHDCADADLNCTFPIDRLHDLAAEGFIAGTTESHFSMGFTQQLAAIRSTTVPLLARAVDRVRPDAVLLTAG
jgi:D-proline reductase (dithiol) PrdB